MMQLSLQGPKSVNIIQAILGEKQN